MKREKVIDCDECKHMIGYEDQDKWPESGCGKCGRTKKELIELDKKIWGK
jgi:Zn finger protein HypA/HybF involved in hydrogenase expression